MTRQPLDDTLFNLGVGAPGRPHTICVIYIRATPQQIWSALTSRETSRLFFHDTDVELHVGGAIRLLNPSGQPIVAGEVLAVEAPQRLLVSWGELSDPDTLPGHVEYLIDGQGEVSAVTVLNYDIPTPSDDDLAMGRNGWSFTLSSLKSLLETGAPLPQPA
ncbi:MAG: SRPBCC domain-containing protein [Alphaproteobacteria bacterium]|mgnify:CR=1 FL=1|nr:SRPBCC domain-containing protein [Alphaproteobacteria bacterium]